MVTLYLPPTFYLVLGYQEGTNIRNIVIGAIAVSAIAVYLNMEDKSVSAEQIVARPPAQVYAELDRLYTAVERRAVGVTPVVGTPPVSVKLTFEREPGEMLGLSAKGGFRDAWLKTWIEPGANPNETRLKVAVWPETMLDRAGMSGVHSAVEAILHRTEAQLTTGKELPALFGERPKGNVDHASNDIDRPFVAAGSTKPMVDASVPTSGR